MKTVLYATAASLVAGAALAGGYAAQVESVVTAPAAPAGMGWGGFYGGVQYGVGDADLDFMGVTASVGDFDAFGLHIGYLHDMGRWIIGGELDYNRVDWDRNPDSDLLRLRGRVGYDFGRFQPYMTLGIAGVTGEDAGIDYSETGITYGIGAEYLISDRFSVGAEYSRADFSDFMEDETGLSGAEMEARMFQFRLSYRF